MGADMDIIEKDSEQAACRAQQFEAAWRKREGNPRSVRGTLEQRGKRWRRKVKDGSSED